MQIIVYKQALTIINHGVWVPSPTMLDPNNGRYEGGGGPPLQLRPSEYIQEAPEWIRSSSTFEAAVKAGYIVEITRVSPQVVLPQPQVQVPANESFGLTAPGAPVVQPEDVPTADFGGGPRVAKAKK